MKKSTILGVTLGLAALTGLGWSGVSMAQERYRGDREWRDEGRSGPFRARDFMGTWRLEDRRDRDRWDQDGRRGRGGLGSAFVQLPSVMRIDVERRELRVESMRGRLLREIDLRGGDARDGRLQVVTRVGGARVVETFTIRGRRLVVHTTVQGRRGSDQFTSIYERA